MKNDAASYEKLPILTLRGHRLENLLVEEGSRTEGTIDLFGTLAVAPDRYTFANLTDIADLQRLRVQPLNELAYSLNHAGGHIEDPEVLERVTIGLQLPRYHNYFLYPVRHNTSIVSMSFGGSQ